MTAICPIPLDICSLRVTRLTSTGAVAAGPNNSYVTTKLTQLPVTPVIETGDDLTKKGGCSCIVATAKLPDMLKRFEFQLAKDALEPALEEMLLGATIITSGPDPIGVWYAQQVGCDRPQQPLVAIEAWSKNWIDDHQDPTLPWTHWLWPATRWQLAPFTLQSDFVDVPVAGFSQSNPLWGHGPYGDQSVVGVTPSSAPGGYWFQAADPPAGVCGYQTVSPSS